MLKRREWLITIYNQEKVINIVDLPYKRISIAVLAPFITQLGYLCIVHFLAEQKL